MRAPWSRTRNVHTDNSDELQPDDLELIAAAESCRGFDDEDDLEQAVRHTRLPRFGRTEVYLRPLSRQFKAEIKRLFSIDRDIFSEADRVLRLAYLLVFFMRIVSVGMFLIFLIQVLVAFDCSYGACDPRLSEFLFVRWSLQILTPAFGQPYGLLAFIFAWGTTWSVLRIFVLRAVVLHVGVSNIVKLFAAHARTRYDAIDSKITEATANSEVIGNPEADGTYRWPLRAKLELIVALWNAKRAEYLDRYSTIIFWKIRWFVSLAEWIASSIKLIAVIFILVVVWLQFHAYNASHGAAVIDKLLSGASKPVPLDILLMAAALVVATGFVGFFILGRLRNDHWTTILVEEIRDPMLGETHYFYRFGAVAEEFARRVMGPTRLQETGAPPPEDDDD